MPRSVMELFLSSTSVDLDACRAKVRETIARMRQPARLASASELQTCTGQTCPRAVV